MPIRKSLWCRRSHHSNWCSFWFLHRTNHSDIQQREAYTISSGCSIRYFTIWHTLYIPKSNMLYHYLICSSEDCLYFSLGISAIFAAPLTGVMLSLELLLNEYRPVSLGSYTASSLRGLFFPSHAFFEVPGDFIPFSSFPH
jgi:hypothetical protein